MITPVQVVKDFNRFGFLGRTGYFCPMITLFSSQGDFCAIAIYGIKTVISEE
jgi:hypothetical protein